MSRVPFLKMVELRMSVPRGFEAYWRVICELDDQGPWMIRTIADRTNVHVRTVSRYVDALRLGGYVQKVAEKPNVMQAAFIYRLVKKPIDAPRLRRDGTELPETANETIWRAIKMSKDFGAAELAEMCPAISVWTVRGYLTLLERAGVIAKIRKRGAKTEGRYRLVQNLGARAPKIIGTRAVFDPNANRIVGTAEGREVQP